MRTIPLLLIMLFTSSCKPQLLTLGERLSTLDVERIDTLVPDTTLFSEAFEIHLLQPVDHNNPDGDQFSQRIYLSWVGADRPVVMVTEGYGAPRNYKSELAEYLGANQLIVEHRYFGESVPEGCDWKYLDTWQAASDHHRIIELFSELFDGPWITTGISKGGQTVIFHSFHYPDDADVRVPYVAPLNFGPEDPRIYTFLDTVSSDYCRNRVYEAQVNMLEKRDLFYPMMMEIADERGYTFRRIGGPEKAFEYTVLEYDFAYWQWGRTACEDILVEGDDRAAFDQFFRISGLDYFSDSGISQYEPFFYQALTEIGYYGYRFERFGDLLRYAGDGDKPDFAFSAPEGVELEYNYELMKEVDSYVRFADNFIFIYGMQDTWTATGVIPDGSSNSLRILKRGGDHTTRISNLPESQRALVMETLDSWICQ